MDLLFSKYASPFLFMDGMIQTCRFSEFIDEFWKLEDEHQTWEFYLHKVFDKSFDDFKASVSVQTQPKPTKEQLETTIQKSQSMLNNFTPKE